MTTLPADELIALRPVPVARPRRRALAVLGVGAVLAVGGGAGGYAFAHRAGAAHAAEPPRATGDRPVFGVTVDLVVPTVGGIARVCVQPGTVEPFEAADLYAKVSGFLSEQSVDIGSRVEAGQVLARLAVPEADRQVERDAAKVQHADAVVRQMRSRIVGAEAEARSAAATVAVAKLLVKGKGAYRKFREKQLTRLKALNADRAIDAKVVDESEDQYEAAVEAQDAAVEAVTAAEQRLIAATARIEQGRADLEEAQASVRVAAAELERSKVFVGYCVITSPYDGVVTRRSFSRGDFVRSADSGGERVPLFAVERTDKMRVVVQVPDRDVPYTNAGDGATVEIDALPGKPLETVIARVAESEDTATRSMRTEIDLPNADGRLRRGMYGRVTLLLEVGSPDVLTVPSTALAGKTEAGRATLKVVRDGVVRVVPVVVGTDNGIRAEVLSGLLPGESVVVRSSGPADDGTPVTVPGQ